MVRGLKKRFKMENSKEKTVFCLLFLGGASVLILSMDGHFMSNNGYKIIKQRHNYGYQTMEM